MAVVIFWFCVKVSFIDFKKTAKVPVFRTQKMGNSGGRIQNSTPFFVAQIRCLIQRCITSGQVYHFMTSWLMCFRSKFAVALKHTSQYKVRRNRQGGAQNNAGWVGDLVRISFGGKARLVSTTGVTTGQPALCSVHCCWRWSPKFGKSGDVGLPACSGR